MKKKELNALPKPFGTYYYKMADSDLQIIIQKMEKGWGAMIRHFPGDHIKICEYYPSKTDAMEIAARELKSLGFKKKQIDSMVNIDSIYEYHTFPMIRIFSEGSRWGWQCDEKHGVEKTKKLALEKACKYRKDI